MLTSSSGEYTMDNQALLNKLFPSLEAIMKAPLADGGNAIMQITGLEYGNPGSGKSQTIRWLVEEARKRYPSVSACWSKGDMRLLLNGGFEPTTVNILFGDDMTNYPFGTWEKWAFFNVRHLMQKATGLSRGLVIIFMGVHDIYRIPKDFRLDVNVHLMKNAPSNDSDERFYQRKIAKDHDKDNPDCKCNMCWLNGNQDSWIEDPTLKRFGVWKARHSMGRFEAEWIQHQNMTELFWKGRDSDPLRGFRSTILK